MYRSRSEVCIRESLIEWPFVSHAELGFSEGKLERLSPETPTCTFGRYTDRNEGAARWTGILTVRE